MPKCNDKERQRLIWAMAKRSSLAAAEAVLEDAVKFRDAEQIKTATAMIQHALSVKPNPYEDYIMIDAETGQPATDAFYGELRPVKCKPEDCEDCFWKIWCEMKESFDTLIEADAVIKRGKELLSKSTMGWGG